MELSGAEILIQCLQDEGVEHIFGYPGGAVLHIYDALFKQDKVQHILVRHEQGAAHAADGYARSTGRPGVALVTSGPGATNAVTGIATAHLDSIPMVVFTGQVPTAWVGSDAFQEVDTVGITRPCSKHNFLVKDVNELAITIKKAFYLATTGRPGPVVVDLPKDITDPSIKVPYFYPKNVVMRSYNPTVKGNRRQIKKAMEVILAAKQPVFYTGGGIILDNASAKLTELVDLLRAPITSTLMGLGAYAANKELFLGMLGMHGTYEANMVMHECDVLIAAGVRFDDRVTGDIAKFCPNAKIIHIDIDPSSISKNVRVDIPIVGSVKNVFADMIDIVKKEDLSARQSQLSDWMRQIDGWRSLDCLHYDRNSDLIKPQFVLEALCQHLDDDCFITSDVGQHQMWAAQYLKFQKPRHWITSGGLGTMGFGLPAAIGVQIAHPDATVVCITGESSIQMCIQELATCRQFNLPIKVIVLHNRFMGMVRQWQEFFYGGRYSQSNMDITPDFVKLVESYGHIGMRVEKPEEVEAAIKQAFSLKDRFVFMDVHIDHTENVFPMIHAGKGHHEMALSPHLSSDRELI